MRGLLTTSSIQIAQKYYELPDQGEKGETSLAIDEKIKQVLSGFSEVCNYLFRNRK